MVEKTKDPVGRWLLFVAAIGVVGILALRWWPGESSGENETAEAGELATEAAAAEDVELSPYRKLQGRWLRPDGGYILDLKYVGDDGRVEAAYLNPRVIYVSRAEATDDGGSIKLLVELQDVGYPGCVYTLRHDSERDVLVGDYFQAAMGQSFEVEFVRAD